MTSSDTNNSIDTKGVHPLSSAGSSNGSTPASSTPSSPPLSVNNTALDDVTTIFVVGFPDDMQEREFQNMFIFSKGFEAASLKWHCKDQDEQQQQQQEYNATMLNNNMMNKKQMIGFARFRTRAEASEAAETLNGKKVDMEKGSVLKAEMAKKNLHIKRGSIAPSAVIPSAVLLPEPTLSPLASFPRRLSHPQICSTVSPTSVPDYESFSPLPSDLLSPGDYKNDPFLNDSLSPSPIPFSSSSSDHPIPSFTDSFFGIRSQSYDARANNNGIKQGSPVPPSIISTQPFPLFSKSLVGNELTEAETDPFHYLSKSSPVPNDRIGFISQGTSLFGDDPSFNSRKKSISINTTANNRTSGMIPPSSPIHNNQHRTSISGNVNINPADQNPPCNTLYVGNLPQNTSEDELKELFSSCQGYKRMSFRTKPQGPMCFVEFEDVVFATQAMNEHQGHVLSNSVKGGIRLSFSKNPLFIKPTKESGISFSFRQMGTALLADL